MSTALITTLGILAGIVLILILITAHEFAHFVIAKYVAKAYVYEFSIGLGPKIWQWGKKETRYTLRLIPLGGYVYIASTDLDPPRGREQEVVPSHRMIEMIHPLKRMLFILAGAIFNFFIAVFLLTTIFMATGIHRGDLTYWGATYTKNEAAYLAIDKNFGRPSQEYVILDYSLFDKDSKPLGQKVVLGNDTNMIPNYYKTVYSFLDNFRRYPQSYYVNLTFAKINRYHQRVSFTPKSSMTLSDTPYTHTIEHWRLTGSPNKPTIGIAAPNRIFNSTTAAYGDGWKTSGTDSISILEGFGRLFSGNFSQLSGPIGLFRNFGNTSQENAAVFFDYVALLSANLFVLNLLPLAPLDGYKFCETVYEGLTRRAIPERVKVLLTVFGILLFATLVVGLSVQDLMR